MINKVLLTTFAIVALASIFAAPSVYADPPEKIEICHRNNNVKQPYGPKRIEVSVRATDGEGSGNSDHYGVHVGPIASTEAEAILLKEGDDIKWGDIIPAIPGVHEGQNWDAEGQAIWNKDCQYVTPGQGSTPDETKTPVIVTPGSGTTPVVVPAVPASGVLPATSGGRTFAYTLIAAGLATIVTGIAVGFNALYRRSV